MSDTYLYDNAEDGLNALLDDAQERVASFVDDKHAKVQETRNRLARYRGAMQGLFEDVKYTRICEATLGQQLLGTLPAPVALEDQSEASVQITSTHEDYSRVAQQLIEDRPITRRVMG